MSKQIELLHEMMPAATIALIVNPNNPNAASDISDAKMAAQTVGHQIIVLNASAARDIDPDLRASCSCGSTRSSSPPMHSYSTGAIS
jgi:ABC-type uncharacterized transport system substrate-binding protein